MEDNEEKEFYNYIQPQEEEELQQAIDLEDEEDKEYDFEDSDDEEFDEMDMEGNFDKDNPNAGQYIKYRIMKEQQKINLLRPVKPRLLSGPLEHGYLSRNRLAGMPIDKREFSTRPYLTKYEAAKVLGSRAAQLARGAEPMIPASERKSDPYDLAIQELRYGVLPFIVCRRMSDGMVERWPLKDLSLELLDMQQIGEPEEKKEHPWEFLDPNFTTYSEQQESRKGGLGVDESMVQVIEDEDQSTTINIDDVDGMGQAGNQQVAADQVGRFSIGANENTRDQTEEVEDAQMGN